MLLRLFVLAGWIVATAASFALGEEIPIAKVQRETPVDFDQEIAPLLRRSCLACHNASQQEGGLVLESPAAMRKGGDSGPAVSPGRSGESLLLKLAAHQVDPVMPPLDNEVQAQPLSSEELGLLKLWIDQGARGDSLGIRLSPKAWNPLPQQLQPAYAVAIDPTGQWVAAGRGNRLLVYHAPSGRLVAELSDPETAESAGSVATAHRDLIESLAFNQEGDLLASGGFRQVKVWRRPSDVQLTSTQLDGQGRALAVSPSASLLAVAAADHRIILLDAATGEIQGDLSGHTDRVRHLEFGPGGRLVSAAQDGSLRWWDVAARQEVDRLDLPAPAATLACVKQVPDDDAATILATAGEDRLIRLWRVPPAAGGRARIVSVAEPFHTVLSPDRQWLATVESVGRVRMHQRATPEDGSPGSWTLTSEFAATAANAVDIAVPLLGADRRPWLAVVDQEGWLNLYRANPGALAGRWRLSGETVTAVAYGHDGASLVTSEATGRLSLWRVDLQAEGEPRLRRERSWNLEGRRAVSIVLKQAGDVAWAACEDGALLGVSLADGQVLFTAAHGGPLRGAAAAPQQDVLATLGQDGQVKLWKPDGAAWNTGRVAELQTPAAGIALGSRWLAATQGGDEAAVYDLATGKLVQRLVTPGEAIQGLAWSGQDESQLIAATAAGCWRMTVLSDGVLEGHTAAITGLAAGPPASRQLLSGSLDGTVRRWDLADRRQLAAANHGGPVQAVAFSPDGKRAASAGENRLVKLWNEQGAAVAEMRGDARLQHRVDRWRRRVQSQQQRITAAERRADAATKDLPGKTEAEKKAAQQLAEAETKSQSAREAEEAAERDKAEAEKKAIALAAEARGARQKQLTAEREFQTAERSMQTATRQLAELTALLQSAPDRPELKKAVEEAQARRQAAEQQVAASREALASPRQAAAETAARAGEAADAAAKLQKPFNDARAAAEQAKQAERLARQQHQIARRELTAAEAAVPEATAAVEAARTLLDQLEESLKQAQADASDAEQPWRDVAFSPDGELLAAGGDARSLQIWDAVSGAAVEVLAGHEAPPQGLAFLDNGRLASLAADGVVKTWDVRPAWRLEQRLGELQRPDLISHRAMCLAFDSDASLLAVGGGFPSRNGELHVFDWRSGQRPLFLPQAHDDVIHAVRFSPDDGRIATAGADKMVQIFDVQSSRRVHRLEGHTDYVLAVDWRADGQQLASSSADNSVKLWNAETGDRVPRNDRGDRRVTGLRFLGDSDRIATAAGDGTYQTIVAAGGGNGALRLGEQWLHGIDVTADGGLAVVGGADGVVHLIDTARNQKLRELTVPTDGSD